MSDYQLNQNEIDHAIALANTVMRTPVPGVSLRMFSEFDRDAEPGESSLMPPGVRRIGVAIDHPATLRDVEDAGTVRLVVLLYVADTGPSLQVDAHSLLRWAARIEAAGAPVDDAAEDLSHLPTVRAMGRSSETAREVATSLASARDRMNDVAEEVRDSVANVGNWLPIRQGAIVVGTASLHRIPTAEANA